MPGRSAAPQGTQTRRRVTGAATLLLGAGWLALAVPVTVAALARLPGEAVLRDLRAGQAVATAELHVLADSRRAAARWRVDPRDRAELALAALLLAERADAAGGDAARGRQLRAAERELSLALGAAPADPYAWSRLALVRWRLDRPARSVRAALAAAQRTGPRVRRLQPLHRALDARIAKDTGDG